MLQDFAQDIPIGIRSLMRVPIVTLTIIVTVGVGIGAAVAMFSAINAALLRRRERTARHRQADLPDLESVVPLSSHRLEARRYGTCPMPQATASTPRPSPHQRTNFDVHVAAPTLVLLSFPVAAHRMSID